MTTEQHIKTEAQDSVLFDEDYRTHIEKLNAMLKRERDEVWALRQECDKLKERLLVKEYEL